MATNQQAFLRPAAPLSRDAFVAWLQASKADIRVWPYTIKRCVCGDLNCRGWRLVAAGVVLLALLHAAPAFAQSPIREALYRVSQGAAIAAHGADGFSTEYALARGAIHETNPAVLRVTTSPAWFGAVDMSLAALSLWLTSRLHNRTLATVANSATAGFFGAVAWHNTRVIARAAHEGTR